MLKFFSAAQTLKFMSLDGPSSNTKELFLCLSEWFYEVLPATKIKNFLANSLPGLYDSAPSSAIP